MGLDGAASRNSLLCLGRGSRKRASVPYRLHCQPPPGHRMCCGPPSSTPGPFPGKRPCQQRGPFLPNSQPHGLKHCARGAQKGFHLPKTTLGGSIVSSRSCLVSATFGCAKGAGERDVKCCPSRGKRNRVDERGREGHSRRGLHIIASRPVTRTGSG